MPSSLRACRSRFCLLSLDIGRIPKEGVPPRNGRRNLEPNVVRVERDVRRAVGHFRFGASVPGIFHGTFAPGKYPHFMDSAVSLFGYNQHASDNTGAVYVGDLSYNPVITARSVTGIDALVGMCARFVQKLTMQLVLSAHIESATAR